MFIIGLIVGIIMTILLYSCILVSKGTGKNEVRDEMDVINKKLFTNKEVAMYGATALHNLKKSGNIEINELLFYSYILSLIELHSKEKINEIYNTFINDN